MEYTQYDDIYGHAAEEAQEDITAPSYYRWVPGVECVDVIQHFNLCRGAAMKYIWRAGRKTSDPRSDLLKAITFLEIEIRRVAAEEGDDH